MRRATYHRVLLCGLMLVGVLLQSNLSGCGRKGPPQPLHPQAPSTQTPEGERR